VVISGLFRPEDFILDGNPHNVCIRDLQFTHNRILSAKSMAKRIITKNLNIRK
jgi:hypothetical protein